MKLRLSLVGLGLVSLSAHANVCGTDYQNFNPTTNGLDFVTVQSSETLRPCVINTGVFFNYAINSLTYSETLNSNFPSGQKRRDRTLGIDVSMGMGITDRWDFGVNVPFVASQTVQDDYYVSRLGHNGATEIKANTKYHLLGDARGGLAAILSVNQNLVEDNPFSGHGAGLTWNYELAADTTLAEKWALALNLGYRDRNPGTPIAGVPFIPLADQWIYSTAASYLFTEWDTKVIFEIYGSRVAKKVSQDTDRGLNSLEGLLGVKYDYSESMALHFGGSHQIDSSMGGAEWRIYAGFNWALGPVCKKAEPQPVAVVQPAEPSKPEVFTLDAPLLFKSESDTIAPVYFEALDLTFKEVFSRDYERLVVEGHTDSVGEADYNLALSQRRANFVRQYLIDRYKVPAAKIEATGLGQTQPIADNGNYQGRRQNRRVEIKVWRKK